MEIKAVLHALGALKKPCVVHVHTDSRYVCDAVAKKWLNNWLRNGWKTSGKKDVKNRDLWERLLPLLHAHDVHFHWIKGHAGHPENERCDELAKNATDAMDEGSGAYGQYAPKLSSHEQ